jgi:hypothetical protein
MSTLTSIANNVQRWAGASQLVVKAVQNASSRTGVSFDYLMNKARQESSFNPSAKAGTSSATGLFQFIESTWLNAVKAHGSEFGLGEMAAKISSDGRVSDPATRQQILKLRENPEIAANLTAAMTKDNADYLSTSLGGKVGESELYMAHFLGLGGANKFLQARQQNGFQPAADLFPQAAAANKNVFYDASGRKKSLDDVYNFFAQKMGGNSDTQVVQQATATPNTLVALPKQVEAPVLIGAVGRPLLLDSQIAASQGLELGKTSQRQLLETLLAGMNNFGFGVNASETGKVVNSGQLLSPYTAMILANLYGQDMSITGEKKRGS